MVRAKFKVIAKEKTLQGDQPSVFEIRLQTVVASDNNEENDSFFRATPYGVITLRTVNKGAADNFTQGSEYYVDFTPAK